jgi:hypothetical protein
MADDKQAQDEKKRQEEAKKRQEEQRQKDEEQRKRQEEARKKSEQGRAGGGKEAKTGRATSTYNAMQGGADDKKDPRGDTFLTHDEIRSLAGDIGRGELGHLELDEEGHPTGSVFREIPKPDQVTTTVIGNPAPQVDEIVTPSGAPVSKFMNPDPVLWDAGMLARNPQPEQPGDMPSGPIGGGVVNQPVHV